MKTWFETAGRTAVLMGGCAIVALSGCAEVTFKRGAGPGEMQATEQGCRAKSADVEAYKACLNAAGFIYAKPSGDTALFADDDDSAGIAVTSEAIAESQTSAPAAAPMAASPTSSVSAGAPTVTVEPSGRAGESLPEAAKSRSKPPTDPLKKVTVASWWKLGGTAGGLEADQASCGTTLGDAHTVAPNAKVVTVGMLRCLKTKGWFAVGR